MQWSTSTLHPFQVLVFGFKVDVWWQPSTSNLQTQKSTLNPFEVLVFVFKVDVWWQPSTSNLKNYLKPTNALKYIYLTPIWGFGFKVDVWWQSSTLNQQMHWSTTNKCSEVSCYTCYTRYIYQSLCLHSFKQLLPSGDVGWHSLVENMVKKNRTRFPIAVLLTTLVCSH